MSMLAEPRRKQKWSVDPRNSAWSNNESKFGQKMLERMGWSKGKGLGKSEQGGTEHIKVKVKNNSLGLGTSVYNEDNWIAHQDDYNQLLADLNNCHGQNNAEEPTPDQSQGFSLEEKSKSSKKRVHYMKFTKGKDLSNRSETDLACIFGKRSKQTRDQDEASCDDSPEEHEISTNDKKDSSPKRDVDMMTVTSSLTMQEYFAQRMAQLKKSQNGAQSGSSSPRVRSSLPSPSASPKSNEDSTCAIDVDQSQKKKKKKKKKDKKANEEEERVEVMTEELPSVIEEAVDVELGESERKKQKKKKKKQEMREKEEEAEEHTLAFEVDMKRNRSKEKETASNTLSDAACEHGVEEKVMDGEVSDKKRKKRKRKGHGDKEEEVGEKRPKKDKKNRD